MMAGKLCPKGTRKSNKDFLIKRNHHGDIMPVGYREHGEETYEEVEKQKEENHTILPV
jgi:hypothetical protein